MSQEKFPTTLIQAITNWQRGGTSAQKADRGRALKAACATLPSMYKSTGLVCFRQLSLSPKAIWLLHERLGLDEAISSWTLTADVAKGFKGGPPLDSPGVILEIVPPEGSVVVNLDSLYRDTEFLAACQAARHQISGYAAGIGTYGNSQNEVVLELPSVPLSCVYALGGHSSSRETIARIYFGHDPTKSEWDEFAKLEVDARVQFGPNWIVGDAKDRILSRTLEAYGIIKAREDPSPDESAV